MTEIPEVIRKTAEELFAPFNYQYDGPSAEDVAELILAERSSIREKVRLLMLRQPTTEGRDTYADGFHQGLAAVLSLIDAA